MSKLTAEEFEEALEAAYWKFDAMRNGYHPYHEARSERDAFKQAVRELVLVRLNGFT